jgi:hypothetical protein
VLIAKFLRKGLTQTVAIGELPGGALTVTF